MILIVNLPIDKSNCYAPHYGAYMDGETYQGADNNLNPPKHWWKKDLDKARGRNRPRQRVSIDQFVKESKDQGTKK